MAAKWVFNDRHRQALRREDFTGVVELVAAIGRVVDGWTSAASRLAGSRTPTRSWASSLTSL